MAEPDPFSFDDVRASKRRSQRQYREAVTLTLAGIIGVVAALVAAWATSGDLWVASVAGLSGASIVVLVLPMLGYRA